jgi:hypothetical protein
MLAQAAELMTMVVPEPVVAPEALEVSLPTPEQPEKEIQDPPSEEAPAPAVPVEEEPQKEYVSLRQSRPKMKKERHYGKLIAVLLALFLLGGAAFGGYYYYNYYFQI